MTLIVSWMGPVLELAICIGLLTRRRVGRAVTLPLLLAALVATDTTVGLCPECNTWDFWLVKEFVHVALFLALGVEIGVRAFTEPVARRVARAWMAGVSALGTVLVFTTEHGLLIVEVLPRLMGTLALLYLGLAGLLLVLAPKVDPLHDTVLSAFSPYLVLYAATWSQAATSTRVPDFVNPLVFVFVLVALLHAAWRPERPPGRPYLRRRSGAAPHPPS